MSGSWMDRLGAIGQNLLTLEINTVVTSGLSAQKMPEVPLALHTLAQAYADYVATIGFQVTLGLLKASARRVAGPDTSDTEALLRPLQAWPFPKRGWTDAEKLAHLNVPPRTDDTPPALELTNGAETFEALQWAAWAALQTMRAGRPLSDKADASVLSRISANSRQLKEAALRLEHQHYRAPANWLTAGLRANSGSAAAARKRMGDLVKLASRKIEGVAGQPPEDAPETSALEDGRLFGGTVEQTARALFEHPRPAFDVDPDVTILIRKAWDIGVERVCLQSVIQIDGDVLQVLGDMPPDDREFLVTIHKQAVAESAAQWRTLFELVEKLAKDAAGFVFKS